MAERYEPPEASTGVLDNIPSLIASPQTKVIKQALAGKKFLCKLPGGQLYFDAALQLDSDGSAYSVQDKTGQAHTSARYAGGKSMDADTENFFVLPGGFYTPHGIRVGDIGVVIYQAHKVFACFGDVGPTHKLGEGSIALHRSLGHETVTGGRLNNVGIADGVLTIVFPGSGNGRARTNAECRQIGEPLLLKLFLEADAYQWNQLTRLRMREIMISGSRRDVEFQLVDWMQEVVENTPHPEGSERLTAARLVLTASGIDLLMHAPPGMSIPASGSNSSGRRRTVRANFTTERTTSGRWYISHVHFSVRMSPAEQSAATRRMLEDRL